MALATKIASTSLVPITTSRHMIGGPVASTDSNALRELDETNPLYQEGSAFRYENFTQHRQQRTSQGVPQRRFQGPEYSNSLMANSTASFATAFASELNNPASPTRGVDYTSLAAMTHGVGAYETTASVIHNEIEPLGGNVSLVL